MYLLQTIGAPSVRTEQAALLITCSIVDSSNASVRAHSNRPVRESASTAPLQLRSRSRQVSFQRCCHTSAIESGLSIRLPLCASVKQVDGGDEFTSRASRPPRLSDRRADHRESGTAIGRGDGFPNATRLLALRVRLLRCAVTPAPTSSAPMPDGASRSASDSRRARPRPVLPGAVSFHRARPPPACEAARLWPRPRVSSRRYGP